MTDPIDYLEVDHLEGGRKKLPSWLLIVLVVATFGCTLVCLFSWDGIVALLGG